MPNRPVKVEPRRKTDDPVYQEVGLEAVPRPRRRYRPERRRPAGHLLHSLGGPEKEAEFL